ncbi:MAG TPA: bifunctional UDP-N-acetylglucosamine diphosphorylase/glucosamine-1-phosphate N-acetyltransferase GlmU [Gaiellaceae bacterium]|nr:bifunctional UDP-N-acetylglucosamine diphosphorylase/glucosamine-1-phosphate N-acetyltransferase GlmU [Gaiellaceae bacterium]
MNGSELAAVVLAGGLGTRMRSATPKHLHLLLGRRLVDWVIEAGRALDPARLVVVSSPDFASEFDGVEVAVQETARGTGDALASARDSLAAHAGDVLVLSGDAPLLRTESLASLLETHRAAGAAATVLTFRRGDPGDYGRIVRGNDGGIRAIVEATDATPEQLAVDEVNSSIYVFRGEALWPTLERLDPANAQGELYLTDAVRHLVDAGERVLAHEADDPIEPEGVNTRVELAAAAAALRDRINEAHMLAGVTIVDPATTWIEASVEIQPDVVIGPFTMLNGGTTVGEGASVGSHVVAVDAVIGPRVLVGPFCYLRPGTVLEAGAKAGTFVEIKNSRVGEGTKVPHLSYIGDADVGDGANVGAGNITANFAHKPGQPKGRTTIGRNVRTGVHNAFIAPVEIGDGAWIGAGSVITRDVPAGALGIARARQENKEGYAERGTDRTEGTSDDD